MTLHGLNFSVASLKLKLGKTTKKNVNKRYNDVLSNGCYSALNI